MTATAPGFKADLYASEIDADVQARLDRAAARDAAVLARIDELTQRTVEVGASDYATPAERDLAGVVSDLLDLIRAEIAHTEQGDI